MNFIILTQNSTPIFKYVVWILGKMMEGIFYVLDKLGIPNIGLAIILFTIVVNLIMLPLTIKQQKFAKLNAKISPEIQAIQNKYKNKKDNESMMAQNNEVQAVYAKYGVSPTGSCAYLLIQMPIIFALYRVIQNMPAYVSKIGDAFRVLADKIYDVDKAAYLADSGIESISKSISMYGKSLTSGIEGGSKQNIINGVIDVLNRLSTSDMSSISEKYDLASLQFNGQNILSTIGEKGEIVSKGLIDTYNSFLGLNIGNSPVYTIKEAWTQMTVNGNWSFVWVLIGAALIPILSGLTQWISAKLMPQQDTSAVSGNDQAASMAQSMKTMNTVMPLMSVCFCISVPTGLGIYWIAGAVVRGIQQVAINKHIDKLNFDDIIKKNAAKSAKKLEKMKKQQERINAYASMNTKSIQSKANFYNNSAEDNSGYDNSTSYNSASNAKPGSIMAKANMVKNYNEKNGK